MKRRSQEKTRKHKNTYGPKKRSGNMMYGPTSKFKTDMVQKPR